MGGATGVNQTIYGTFHSLVDVVKCGHTLTTGQINQVRPPTTIVLQCTLGYLKNIKFSSSLDPSSDYRKCENFCEGKLLHFSWLWIDHEKFHDQYTIAKKNVNNTSSLIRECLVMLCYVIVLRRISDWLYNGAPLVAFYDTLGIRRTYSRLKPRRPRGRECLVSFKLLYKAYNSPSLILPCRDLKLICPFPDFVTQSFIHKLKRTLMKSQKVLPRVFHYDSYFFEDDFDLWTPDPILYSYLPLTMQHLCMYNIGKLYIKTYLSYHVRTKILRKYILWLWPLNNKMYSYLHFANLHLCIKCESCT